MLHPSTRLKAVDPAIGLGVVATEQIPRGSIVWVRDPLDQVLTPAEIAALPALCTADLEHYFWQNKDGDYVLCWDIARYVNHDCEPNCISTEFGFEIAVRDIVAGEELTNDYANIGMMPEEQMVCYCGAPRCRGLVSPADVAVRVQLWTGMVAASLADINRVRQPLWPLLPDALQQRLRRLYPAPAHAGGQSA